MASGIKYTVNNTTGNQKRKPNSPQTESEDTSNKMTDNDHHHDEKARIEPSPREILHNFLEYTTAHGCSRLASSRGYIRVSFWLIMCLIAHSLFYYHTFLLVNNYLVKATRVKISMDSKKKLNFPVVTVCNRNMLRKSKLTADMQSRIDILLNATEGVAQDDNAHLDTSSYPRPEERHPDKAQSDSFRSIWSELSKSDLINMGHQLEDMLLDCSFSGKNCRNIKDNKTWRHIWIEDVGNCFMFNHAMSDLGEKLKPHKQLFQGREHGLKLILNIEQEEYVDGITSVAGLRVFIGDHGEMPFPVYDGLSVGPGLSTDVEILMQETYRLDPFQNNSCKPSKEIERDNIYRPYNMSYSKKACDFSCFSHMQQNKCKCSLFEFSGNSAALCNSSNTEVATCLAEVNEEFLEGHCDEFCPAPCFETSFKSIVSSSKWPAENYKHYLVKTMDVKTRLPLTEQHIRENLLEIRVYYANLDYVREEESLKYNFEDLLSDIGGQMGMWIGLSALTMVEVIELCWILIDSFLKNRKAKPSNTVQTIDVSPFTKQH